MREGCPCAFRAVITNVGALNQRAMFCGCFGEQGAGHGSKGLSLLLRKWPMPAQEPDDRIVEKLTVFGGKWCAFWSAGFGHIPQDVAIKEGCVFRFDSCRV
jgi:hypothetical protein